MAYVQKCIDRVRVPYKNAQGWQPRCGVYSTTAQSLPGPLLHIYFMNFTKFYRKIHSNFKNWWNRQIHWKIAIFSKWAISIVNTKTCASSQNGLVYRYGIFSLPPTSDWNQSCSCIENRLSDLWFNDLKDSFTTRIARKLKFIELFYSASMDGSFSRPFYFFIVFLCDCHRL